MSRSAAKLYGVRKEKTGMNIDEIDWNEVWKDLYEQNLATRGKGECASIWETKDRAREFFVFSSSRLACCTLYNLFPELNIGMANCMPTSEVGNHFSSTLKKLNSFL